MLIENPKTEKEIYIYSTILKFTKKNGHVSDKVRVIIRSSKKGGKKKRDLPIPKEINTFNLEWKKYEGKDIATYRRTGNSKNYDYTSGGITISTDLCQKLEELVSEVCFEKTQYTK